MQNGNKKSPTLNANYIIIYVTSSSNSHYGKSSDINVYMIAHYTDMKPYN